MSATQTLQIPLEDKARILETELAWVLGASRSHDPHFALAANARAIELEVELESLKAAIAAA